jgi:hypothetical protein
VNPTFHRTPMGVSPAWSFTQLYASADPAITAQYGPAYRDESLRVLRCFAESGVWDPLHVEQALTHAVAARTPRHEYVVGMDGTFCMGPMLNLPVALRCWVLGLIFRNSVPPAGVAAKQQGQVEEGVNEGQGQSAKAVEGVRRRHQ